MKNSTFYYITILFLLATYGCTNGLKVESAPGAINNRELNQEEITLPDMNLYLYLNASYTYHLDDLPPGNLSIDWLKSIDSENVDSVNVDNRGCIWYEEKHTWDRDYKSRVLRDYSVHLIKLTPNGEILWRLPNNYEPFYKVPSVPLNGAMIFTDVFYNEVNPLERQQSFECIDMNGKTVWRTEPVSWDLIYPKAQSIWRLTDDRIITNVASLNSGKFNIYSLKDGMFINSINFPDWITNEEVILRPIELNDNEWIGFDDLNIIRYNPDLSIDWQFAEFQGNITGCHISSSETLVFTTDNSLIVLDVNSGKKIWQLDNLNNPEICGLLDDGVTLYTVSVLPELKGYMYLLNAVNFSGENLWSFETKGPASNQKSNLIIYKNDYLLFADSDSITLLSDSGNLVWDIPYKLEKNQNVYGRRIFPVHDGSIYLVLWKEKKRSSISTKNIIDISISHFSAN